MKTDLIEPGKFVALRMCGATVQTIRDGTRAIPGYVLGVGKFRTQRQAWCGITTITPVEPPHDAISSTYVAVLRPNERHWDTHNPGPVKIHPDTDWILDLVQPGQCYPWEMFDLAHQDYRMAVAERTAWSQRASTIRKELEQLVHQNLSELIAQGIINPSNLSLHWRWKHDPKPDELEAKMSFEFPESPRDTGAT